MAREQIYEQQTGPQAAAPMPLATPGSYGAAVGQGMAQVGAAVHRNQVEAYVADRRRTADSEWADFNRRFAMHRENMDGVTRQMRRGADPGGNGHELRWREAEKIGSEKLLEGITEDSVRRRAEAQLRDWRMQSASQEADWEEGKRVAKVATDTDEATDIAANRIVSAEDPLKTYAEETARGHDYVDALNVDADTKAKLKRQLVDQKLAVSFVNKLNMTNPEMARGLLLKGQFNEVLTPEQIDAGVRGAEIEIRRMEAAAKAEVEAQQSGDKEFEDTVTNRAQNGLEVDDGDFVKAIGTATARGDTSKAEDLTRARSDNGFAKIYAGQSPMQFEARQSELRGKGKLTEPEQRELAWLDKHKAGRASDFEGDPVGFAIANAPAAMKPPAGDISDPAVMAARVAWQSRASQFYGRSMPYLSKIERDQVEARLNSGERGKLETIGYIASWGAAAGAVARQVAPQDRYLQQLVVLPEAYRRKAIDGQAARKANPKLIAIEDPEESDRVGEMTRRIFAEALPGIAQDQKNAIVETARNIAAGYLAEYGGELDLNMWGLALNQAVGAVGAGKERTGGFGRWGDHYFLAPEGLTAQQFTDRVFGFVKANPDKAPVNPDGSPAYLGRARPVRMGNGKWRFFVGDRAVQGRGKDGKPAGPWEFTLGGAQ